MLIEQIQSRPTCDVNGIIGGYTGEGTKTVIAARGALPRSRSASSAIRIRQKISRRLPGLRAERIPADCSVEFITHKGSRAHDAAARLPGAHRREARAA